MYPDSFRLSEISPEVKKKIKLAVIAVSVMAIVAAVGGVLYYIGTHGVVRILSEDVTQIKISRFDGVLVSQKDGSDSAIVTAGTYDVLAIMKDGSSYSKVVEVKGFMRATAIRPRAFKASAENLGYSQALYDQFVMLGEDVLSYGRGKIPMTHYANPRDPAANRFPHMPLLFARPTGENQVVAIGATGESVTTYYKFIVYDVTSDKTEVMDYMSVYDEDRDTRVGYVGGSNRGLYAVSGDDATSVKENDKLSLKGVNYSFGENTPLISIGAEKVAVVDGNNYDLVGEAELVNSYLRVFQRGDGVLGKEVRAELGKRSDITMLALSPDEKKVLVVVGGQIIVYSTDSMEEIFHTVVYPSREPYWVDGSHIVFMRSDSLIHMADLDEGDTYSFANLGELKVSRLQYVDGGYLYFSAVDSYKRMGAYRIKLEVD